MLLLLSFEIKRKVILKKGRRSEYCVLTRHKLRLMVCLAQGDARACDSLTRLRWWYLTRTLRLSLLALSQYLHYVVSIICVAFIQRPEDFIDSRGHTLKLVAQDHHAAIYWHFLNCLVGEGRLRAQLIDFGSQRIDLLLQTGCVLTELLVHHVIAVEVLLVTLDCELDRIVALSRQLLTTTFAGKMLILKNLVLTLG